jgi:putative redox protein
MGDEIVARTRLDEGMHFVGMANSGHMVDLDSPLEGNKSGSSPMELVLLSLAGCSGMDVLSVLRKKRQPVQGLEVVGRGQRTETYPRVFTAIQLEYIVTGSGVDPQAVVQSIELSRDRYCPVWAMLRPTVDITFTYRIVAPE